MHKIRLPICIWFSVGLCRCLGAAPSGTIPVGETFPSPDGRFTAVFAISDQGQDPGPELTIHDNATGRVENISTLTPLFSVCWAPDSKTVVVTYHVSHMTGVEVFHLDSGKWQKHDVEPPLDKNFRSCMLTRQEFGRKGVELTYKIMDSAYNPKNGGRTADFFICTYVVNVKSGATTLKGKKRRISSSEYGRIRTYGGS